MICETDIPWLSTRSWWQPYNFRSDGFNLTIFIIIIIIIVIIIIIIIIIIIKRQ
jgi:heme/copper-type cytochrome/quinol oxidase subunit 2